MLSEKLSQITTEMGNAKASTGVAAATSMWGVAGLVDMINPFLSAVGTIIGTILSIVLIWHWIREVRRKDEKHTLEMELLKKQIQSPIKEQEDE